MMKGTQVFDEINITPLTDIFLVLLIIMMVVAPMVQQMRSDIEPPDIQSGQNVEATKLIVEVTKDGEFYVMSQPSSADQLADLFRQQVDTLDEKNVIIRADKDTKSGVIMQIFEAARDAEFEKVTVAGMPLDQSRQSALQEGSAPLPEQSQEGGF